MTGLTHIDLFSGIGGFSIACKWNGIETEVFCEKDERCRGFLQRTYPGVPIVPDIREFDGTKWRGRFLLTAGVPCQPASRAGKQRGKDDDRWLWEPALRVVSEARPDWVLFENPLGINDVGLDGILADLEGLDYEVAPPLIIPAGAVNSPQFRNRYWIVGHSNAGYISEREQVQPGGAESRASSQSDLAHSTDQGHERAGSECGQETGCELSAECGEGNMSDRLRSGRRTDAEGTGERGRTFDRGVGENGDMADTARLRREEGWSDNPAESEGGEPRDGADELLSNFWSNSIWLPCADGKLRRAPDDSFGVAYGLHRSILAGLGNSIVPQVAAEIIKAIKETM